MFMKKLTILKQIFAHLQNRQWGTEKPVIHMMPTAAGATCVLYFEERITALEAADDLSCNPINLANIGEIDFEVEINSHVYVDETYWAVTLTFNDEDMFE